MHKTILEREAIDERFQRRSRRTHGAGHVDLPCTAVVEIFRRADPRQHVAAVIVDRDDGDGNIRTQNHRAVARQRLQHLLDAGIQRQPDHRRILDRRHGLIGGMRCEDRHRLAQPRYRHGFGLSRILGRDAAVFDHAIEHAVARRAGHVGMAVEATGFRRLRQRHQQRGFRQRQPLRLLAEIGDRGGPDALEIAAERRQRQIQIEDLVFGQLPLDFDRAHHLPQFGGDRALAPRLHQSRQLHRDGGAAGHDVTARDELKCGASQCQRIDAGMGIETPVFIGQQQLEIAGIDSGPGIDRQSPAAVRHRVSAQQFFVAIDNGGGGLPCLLQRQWTKRDDPVPAQSRQTRGSRLTMVAIRTMRRFSPPSWPGLTRPSTSSLAVTKVVDARVKPGHDDFELLRPDALISPDAPRRSRCRCGRSARDCTCPRHRPAAARICRAKPRARYRPP